MHLGILNMRHLIVGQVGIKIITSITGVRNQTRCREYASTKMEGPALQNKISLTNLPILLSTLSML